MKKVIVDIIQIIADALQAGALCYVAVIMRNMSKKAKEENEKLKDEIDLINKEQQALIEQYDNNP